MIDARACRRGDRQNQTLIDDEGRQESGGPAGETMKAAREQAGAFASEQSDDPRAPAPDNVLAFPNRLSDLFFALARSSAVRA